MAELRDWGGFGAALREAIQDVEREAQAELVACPVCGIPLVRNPRGVLGCPAGDFVC